MRKLLLLRGGMGSGKSSWIRDNDLEGHTLSTDALRLMHAGPMLLPEGRFAISQKRDPAVWRLLMQMLESRMQDGEFLVVDATHTTTASMDRYRDLCKEYRYRCFVVDFQGDSEEELLTRNQSRGFRAVPPHVISSALEKLSNNSVPSWIQGVIEVKKGDTLEGLAFPATEIDTARFTAVHHIGDVHGCYTALSGLMGPEIREDHFYVFVGDYLDRGLENAEVLEYLLTLTRRDNVVFMEGNHERHIWDWSNDRSSVSSDFNKDTAPQLDAAVSAGRFTKSKVRDWFRRVRPIFRYQAWGAEVTVSHGGISLPLQGILLERLPAVQVVKGVGDYGTVEEVHRSFGESLEGASVYQVHGHRTRKTDGALRSPDGHSFCLEDSVEFGGNLRAVSLVPHEETGHQWVPHEVRNTVYRTKGGVEIRGIAQQQAYEEAVRLALVEAAKPENRVSTLVSTFRGIPKLIAERTFGHVSSFNFSKDAWRDSLWDGLTVTARGLFINTMNMTVVARGYDKFFNVGEMHESDINVFPEAIKYPVSWYTKLNGYLGLVGYDSLSGKLWVSSKGSADNEYAAWLDDLLRKGVDTDLLLEYTKRGWCFMFEVIDPVNDPHIIEYPSQKLVLLGMVRRSLDLRRAPYRVLTKVAESLGVEVKEKVFVSRNSQELRETMEAVVKEDYLYRGQHLEGFVLEDSASFMVKVKLAYYRKWKSARGMVDNFLRGYQVKSYGDADLGKFLEFIKSLGKDDLEGVSLIELRKDFLVWKEILERK